MLQIQIDENAVKQLYLQEVEKRLADIDKELVYWDSKELKRRTCMSWNTIQDTFFHEDGFPKVKIGGKWYFPAKAAEEFLTKWLKEKQHNL